MPYVPNTDFDRNEMLKEIGISDFQDLVNNIPKEAFIKNDDKISIKPNSELEITRIMNNLAGRNTYCGEFISFLGGGAYDHYTPSAIHHIISRSEFYTAYTPYQAEVSQGTLQAIYEFQSMICELTGMDATNASLYDGGSATAEAMLLAYGQTRKNKILVSTTLNPMYKKILYTYAQGQAIQIVEIPHKDGAIDIEDIKKRLDDDTAAVILQSPNFFGVIEDIKGISGLLQNLKTLLVVNTDPVSLGVLEAPGKLGADIVVGEGQSLGIPVSYGGPYVGFFGVNEKFLRKAPGRLIGRAFDLDGKNGYIMALQTREQHIRREKATSNICTNQALMALWATIYMSLMGKEGLKEVAAQSLQKSHYLADKISALDGFSLKYSSSFFKEFVVKTDIPFETIYKKSKEKMICPGINLKRFIDEDGFLVAVTEKRTKEEMDSFVEVLATCK